MILNIRNKILFLSIFMLCSTALKAQNSALDEVFSYDSNFNSDLYAANENFSNLEIANSNAISTGNYRYAERGFWMFHLGVNAIGDGGTVEVGQLFKSAYRNFSNPLILGVEYHRNDKFSFNGSISFNKYVEGKNIDYGIILKDKEANYFSVDFATNFNLKKSNSDYIFEPFVFLGLGYTKISSYEIVSISKVVPDVGRLTINVGLGANYWLSDSFGLNIKYSGKVGLKSKQFEEYITNQEQLAFGIFYTSVQRYKWGRR